MNIALYRFLHNHGHGHGNIIRQKPRKKPQVGTTINVHIMLDAKLDREHPDDGEMMIRLITLSSRYWIRAYALRHSTVTDTGINLSVTEIFYNI